MFLYNMKEGLSVRIALFSICCMLTNVYAYFLVCLFLQPLIEPAEEGSLPEDAILWLQYPVVLVWEDEEFGRDATQASCIEGSHALVGIDAVVFLAMDAEDRSVPLVNKLVRTVLVSLLGIGGLVLVPICVIILPVGEPSLLGVGVHALQVEGTIVREECLEALVVMTGKVIY